jgi:hypothetical protein
MDLPGFVLKQSFQGVMNLLGFEFGTFHIKDVRALPDCHLRCNGFSWLCFGTVISRCNGFARL